MIANDYFADVEEVESITNLVCNWTVMIMIILLYIRDLQRLYNNSEFYSKA